jgi:GT2 family glycosyltransferase/glycosyltransferase involved in cell wall biosynthesis
MHRLWSSLVEPILTRLQPSVVVEIGIGAGANTRNLLAFCRARGAVCHAVDPSPAFDVEVCARTFGDAFVFHRARSLEALPAIGAADAVLIDGDHNWYTVFHELMLLDRLARDANAPFPLVLLHDVDWPYGRRDLYYEPDAIPELYRHEFERCGMTPGSPGLSEGSLNDDLANACTEGGDKNGVLTAVEDFVASADVDVRLMRITGFHGLGILAPAVRTAANAPLEEFLAQLADARAFERHLAALERSRVEAAIFAETRERERDDTAAATSAGGTLETSLEQPTTFEPETATESAPEPAPQVDVVICVRDAFEAVRACLASVARHTDDRHRVIVVDDGSSPPCRDAVARFAAAYPGCVLVRNDEPRGYTRAANQGLTASTAGLVVLLNSDTIVTRGWLDRLQECAESSDRIGIVGPLSNAASWQSVPERIDASAPQFGANDLPGGWDPEQMAKLVASASDRRYPRVQLINGFCYAIKRRVIDAIGLLDEQQFPEGYGEEDDYSLRAADEGFELAVADDAYVFHAKSKSFTHERRRRLQALGFATLEARYGARIDDAIGRTRDVLALATLRARLKRAVRELEDERRCTGGSPLRVLFLLPERGGGGGAHSILQEAVGMRSLGVDAEVAIETANQSEYFRDYPAFAREGDVFYVYDSVEDVIAYAAAFDCVVATIFHSTMLARLITDAHPHVAAAYYVQGYEPWMFPEGSEECQIALDSYALVPGATLFAKSEWLRETVLERHGVRVEKVDASLDPVVYFPPNARSGKRVGVAAMIRPSTPYRGAERTMRVLRRLKKHLGRGVEIHIFGCDDADLEEHDLPCDFAMVNAGRLIREEVGELLRTCDVFLDLSDWQAFGRTALEAMACGCAVVVPAFGGTREFAVDRGNALVVDTSSEDECFRAARELIIDGSLRRKLQAAGVERSGCFSIRSAAASEIAVLRRGVDRWRSAEPLRREIRTLRGEVAGAVAVAHESAGRVDAALAAADEARKALEGTEHKLAVGLEDAREAAAVAERSLNARLDERLEYERVVNCVRDTLCARVPLGAVVAVVSKGDDRLVRIEGRRAWHFPCDAAGEFAGWYPADDAEAVAQVDIARDAGARFLVFPKPALWWLDHYGGLRRHLDDHHEPFYADHACTIYRLKRRRRRAQREVEDPPSIAPTQIGYEQLVDRVREVVEAVVPTGAAVAVVSKGDEELLRLDGRRGWHFPQVAGGTYAGHYPATSDEAVAQVEELRRHGAAWLVFPATAYWWLDHYGGLERHLEMRHRRVFADETCIVYRLGARRTLPALRRPRARPAAAAIVRPAVLPPATERRGYAPAADLRFVLAYPETLPLRAPAAEFDPKRMRLNWIVPDFAPGMGGAMAIFRFVKLLEDLGHRSTIWINGGTQHGTDMEARRVIREHFAPVDAEVRILTDNVDEIEGDAVIATHSWTAYPARAVTRVRERFYFVQDFEPLFYPMGAHSLLAETTYTFGFTCITSGKWLQHLMETRYHARAYQFAYACDASVYCADATQPREPDRIAFYARTRTPRRAVELGLLAFELLARRRPSLVVDFFGAPLGELEVPYDYVDHGVLTDLELARLYRRATVGLVFSTTNYSLIPKEMMACDLPVVELAGDSTAVDFPGSTVALAEPTPQAIADTVERLLASRELRDEQAARARAYVDSLSWEESAQRIEHALRETLERRALPPARPPRSNGSVRNGKPRGRLPRRSPGRNGRVGPIVFAGQPEYYRSTYHDLVAGGDHFEFPFTSADPAILRALPSFAHECDARICVVYRPEWFVQSREAFDELKAHGIAVVGYSSEPVPHAWHAPIHEDQLRRLEMLKQALDLDYDLFVHYDPSSIDLLRGLGFRRIIGHPLPVSRTLFYPEERPRDFDVCFLGKSTPYRERMLLPLKMRFNTIHVAHGLRDEDARELMNRSKLVLNIHNENYVNFENRVVQGLFCERPVLSERLSGNLLQPDRDYVLFTSPDELAARVADILNGGRWTTPDVNLDLFTPVAFVERLRAIVGAH